MKKRVQPTPHGEELKTVTEGPLTYSYYVNEKGEKVRHGAYIQRYRENEGGGIWLFDFYNHGIRTVQRSYNRKGGTGWIHPRDSEGKMNGMQYMYWENGNIRSEIPWVDNQKHGVEKNYYADGKSVSSTVVWENGRRK